jgi:hypothetical protein
MALNPDDLAVQSFTTGGSASIGTDGGFCCTGCDSGCGIFPTDCYCESQGQSGGGLCPAIGDGAA